MFLQNFWTLHKLCVKVTMKPMDFRNFNAAKDDSGRRLDKVVSRIFEAQGISRGIFPLIRKGLIKVNGKKSSGEYRVSEGDSILVAEFLFENSEESSKKESKEFPFCLEEITVFIIEKGFTDARKKEIDIRVYIDSEDVIIRTRDNGNPITVMERMEWLEKLQDGDYMGIRMVYKLAQEMQYITTMNINNFIVTLMNSRNLE